MVKDIVTYPTPPSVNFGTDVRLFNEDLFSLIDDLKDTITENKIDGLAAYQIGYYFNVIVVKKDGDFLELINPRVLRTEGKTVVTESTAYFPGLTAQVQRYEAISLVYQDREGKQHSLKADGEFGILLQRKIDYTFGSTFLMKLSKEEKELFESKLEQGSNISIPESCPTVFKRDKILKVASILTLLIALLLLASLFVSNEESLSSIWNFQKYISYATIGVIVTYFFYAQYEGKIFTSCSSCQIGNIIGTALVSLTKLSAIMLISYFVV
ncbi:peptide deformylase [Candidatus Sulfurimonas marisnigri]|uniref:Peptide deformylase n=1 Tax=Candidatus Sulfurimonas marisnigri TaxID=2740405 RepID=A0A7S7RQB9_9BACT|nr:peptide deformylase [Candidatus Sulfurimonas marisnigri]QOY55287.1 peptide deformylase [Candidatus Sulfurimonas marisnigri]